MKNKILYSWEELQKDCIELVKKIKPIKFSFKNIYGVPRGGLVIAVIFSHLLNLPIILDKNRIGRDTLIVDDISDSGNTLKKLLETGEKREKRTILTLWVNPRTKVFPDYFMRTKENEKDWIVMPFETIKSSKYDNKKLEKLEII